MWLAAGRLRVVHTEGSPGRRKQSVGVDRCSARELPAGKCHGRVAPYDWVARPVRQTVQGGCTEVQPPSHCVHGASLTLRYLDRPPEDPPPLPPRPPLEAALGAGMGPDFGAAFDIVDDFGLGMARAPRDRGLARGRKVSTYIIRYGFPTRSSHPNPRERQRSRKHFRQRVKRPGK